jgi:hypothetical protein
MFENILGQNVDILKGEESITYINYCDLKSSTKEMEKNRKQRFKY